MTHSDDDNLQMTTPSQKTLRSLGMLLRVVLPFGILAAGWVGYSILSVEAEKEKTPPAEKQALRTKVKELRVQDYLVVIKTHGVVQAHNQVTLSPQITGQITHINPAFETGAYFSKGEVLLELDTKNYEIAFKIAEAQHSGAESALELADLNHERYKRLVESKAVSSAEVESIKATRDQAEAALDSAKAQMQRAELDRERTKVRAPFDGRVRLRIAGLGQSVGPQTPLGDVFAVDFAEIRLPISGRELQFLVLPEFADDPPVEVELRDAIDETSSAVWKARIVRTEGVLDENTRELFVIARMDDPFGRKSGYPPLRIGQPVVASIAGKVLANVVALPRVAVRQLDQVNLVDKMTKTLVPKTIVPIWTDEENVIVRDPGIKDGTLLATTHLVYAPSGTKVEIIPDIEPTAALAKKDTPTEAETLAD